MENLFFEAVRLSTTSLEQKARLKLKRLHYLNVFNASRIGNFYGKIRCSYYTIF